VTYYNFTSDQFTDFHAIVIPETLRDSMYILNGLLEHQTRLRPVETMADTAGVSDVVFGLFWLVGYQFSPRLADLGEAQFWHFDPSADYGVLNGIARARMPAKLITHNWDDLLRVVGSLHQGTVSASELMCSLLRGKRPSTLTRTVGALGRIPKTLYMLAYVDDECYRRRSPSSTAGKAATAWPVLSFMGNGANCGSAIVKGKRINSGRSAWSSMPLCLEYLVYGSSASAAIGGRRVSGLDRCRAAFAAGTLTHQFPVALLVRIVRGGRTWRTASAAGSLRSQ
jgi:hypothetical protein